MNSIKKIRNLSVLSWVTLWLCVVLCPLMLKAQDDQQGIQWTDTNLSWEEVKAKAKKENKHIFIDFFATWCGPCKEMDKQVYPSDTVGAFFNNKFVALKVQLDKTKNDDDAIQRWYKEAEVMQKKYRIIAFPTLVFLSPDGNMTHKITGYKSVDKLVEEAEKALKPGQVFRDPDEDYYLLLDKYNEGERDHTVMPEIFQRSLKLRQMDVAEAVAKDLAAYLKTLERNKLYTKEYLEFLVAVQPSSRSRFFSVFYGNEKKVNRAMGFKNYAQKAVVDMTIQREIVDSFLAARLLPSTSELPTPENINVDWQNLYGRIKRKYNKTYAKRNLLMAQIKWFDQQRNYPAFVKHYLAYLEAYGIDTWNSKGIMSDLLVNFHCWNIFLRVTDVKQLTVAAKWMRIVVSQMPTNYLYTDTYANLIYKLGQCEEAIKWEQRALNLAMEYQTDRHVKEYTAALEDMKKGRPTWPVK